MLPWLTITSGASGTGNGSVGLSIAANTGVARTGTATIAGQTFTVNQAAFVAPCTYSIASTTPAHTCGWRAHGHGDGHDDERVCVDGDVVAMRRGSRSRRARRGPGTERLGSLSWPTPPAPRTGTLTIAGQTFTVTQN